MITKKQIKVDLTPDKSLYEKLGHGQHELPDAIAELIDNSFDARLPEQETKKEPFVVKINAPTNVKIGNSLYAEYIEIEDNASGMDEEGIKNCWVQGRTTREGKKQGRYGLGLKQSCLSMGRKVSIISKRKDSKKRYILNFDNDTFIQSGSWDDFFIEEEEDTSDWHGTKIKVSDFWEKKLIYYNKIDNIKKRFQWTFGPFIKSKQMVIEINGSEINGKGLEDMTIKNKTPIEIDIESPLASGKRVKVKGWVGFKEESGSSIGFTGFNLFRNERLVKLYEHVGFRYHPELRKLVGELHLDDFPISIDKKDFLRNSAQWIELAGEEEFDENDGTFKGYNTKDSKLTPFLKKVIAKYKQEDSKARLINRSKKEEKEKERKKIFFEDLTKKEEGLDRIRNAVAAIQKDSTEEDSPERKKIYDQFEELEKKENKDIKEFLPSSFLETGKIKIKGEEYSFEQDSKNLDKLSKPYSYNIKTKKISISINTNYPFFDSLRKDFSLYKEMITILALSEAISEIKKEELKKVFDKLFEIYEEQVRTINKLKEEEIYKFDKKLFDASF